ncbi:MAG: peptidylprolyl isomerase [Polyangiaceae bacterium]|nr:peptidylprolyl isomerase [Polyangiaceae bacterium]
MLRWLRLYQQCLVLFSTFSVLNCASSPAPKSSSGGSDSNAEQSLPNDELACLAAAETLRELPTVVPERITVAHVLVRHRELPAVEQNRSRGQACLRALEALEKLSDGLSWNDAVDQYSDAPGAAHGELGRVSQQELEPAFAAAAFGLEVGQLSYVVESPRGFHVILRQQ